MDMKTNFTAVLNPQEEMAKQTTIHSNLKQDIFYTTKDKLHLSLQDFQAAVEAKQKVTTWAGIALSLLLSLVTSSTKDIFWLSADTWRAILILLFIVSIIATARSIVTLVKTHTDRDIETICDKIMHGNSTDDA